MLHKKQSITVSNRRSVTQFFNRVQDSFERKFDGFPALIGTPGSTPAIEEGAIDFNQDELIDAITGAVTSTETSEIPICPTGPEEECVPSENACVYDTFQGTTVSGWGTTDNGSHTWETAQVGNGSARVFANGSARLINVAAGFGTFQAGNVQAIYPLCASDGDQAIIKARFTCNSKTAWISTKPYSKAAGVGFDEAYYAPSMTIDGSPGGGTPQVGVLRQYLNIVTSGISFGTYVNIYNSDGMMWMATKFSNSAYQKLPTAIMPASDNFWVKMWVTSNGTLYLKLWDNASSEPEGWQHSEINRDYNGSVRVGGLFRSNSASFQTTDLRCHFLSVGAVTGIDCPEDIIIGTLQDNGDGSFSTVYDSHHINEVYYDHILAVKDVDYTVSGNTVTPTSTLPTGTLVTAKYTPE